MLGGIQAEVWMKITITVDGTLNTPHEKMECELVVPDDWKPSFETFCKVKGSIRYLSEKLCQEFEPNPCEN